MTASWPRAALTALIAGLILAAPARAVVLTPLADFDSPVTVATAPGDVNRLFVVEESGKIVILRDGIKLDTPFLDVSSLLAGGPVEQRGLLGLAFAPDYARSGLFYIYYTARDATAADGYDDVLAEYRRSSSNTNVADPATRRAILTMRPPGMGHDGGQLVFGPDGYLYLGPGDGQCCHDPSQNGQNLGVLFGKILRIDPRQSGRLPYTIPAGNPFVGVPGARPEIWAYGVRNPWRFSFDRSTRDLVIADVGETHREEVDFLPYAQGAGIGANLGWSCFEGTLTHVVAPGTICPPFASTVAPVLELDHSDGACAIIGGYVIRDRALGSLYGRYLFGDLCDGKVRTALLQGAGSPDVQDLGLSFPPEHLVSFGQDSCGHLYAVDRTGPLYRIDGPTYTPCPSPFGSGGGGTIAGPTASAQTATVTAEPTRSAAPPAPPLLWLGSARRQRVLRHRRLSIAVECNQPCSVAVTVAIGEEHAAAQLRLRATTGSLRGGKRHRIALSVSARELRVLRRRLGRGHRGRAVVIATARYAGGGTATKSRTVGVTR